MTDRIGQIAFARALRRNMTDAERRLWHSLRRLRPRFTRQYPVGPYVADFACRRARLIVELDGGQHAENERDRIRTAQLAASDWQVLRYWNDEVLTDTESVLLDIVARGDQRLPPGERFESVAPSPPRTRK